MKKGIFSVSYSGLWGQAKLNAVEFIYKAKDLGYEGVLLMAKRPHLSVIDSDEAMLTSIETALQETGIELIGLAAYTDYLLPAPAEIPIAEIQRLYVQRCAAICSRLGGRIVRVFTGYDRGDVSRGSQENTVTAELQAAADDAGSHGILLSVQNHHDIGVHTDELNMLLDTVGAENIRAGFDAWSPYLRGEDLYASARLMAPRMFMTICADYLTFPRYRYLPELVNYKRIEPRAVKATLMGSGEISYGDFFRGLADGGFDGWAVYEMCSPVIGGGTIENLDRLAEGFITWIDANSPA
ncbi:MAG: sugar phosphate isomerase/epimerase [Spirochaetales bacterium]|jgi:sugar phosphate isomerase/epimerase|nr:sugar phosphate isomerase/epimerase [Spirochaetales bacterium]